MTKSYKEIKRLKEGSNFQVQEACWDGYKQIGMIKKGDRMVPNCIKEEIVHAVFGKNYIHREPIMEDGMEDMYKGKLNKDQIATIKNTWKNKKASDVTQGVRDMVKKFDTFTRMDLKRANIKYISNLINDEVQQEEFDWISPLQDQIEIVEMNSVVRKTELNEFTTDQINRLAKSYASMSGKTISLANANKLRKMFDRVPDSSLNALRKKKIPFLSGLALSRMIQKKIPVTEDLNKDDENAFEVSGVENNGREELEESDAYDNDRFIIIGNTAKKDNSDTPDNKNHVYAPDSKTALQLYKQGKKVYKEELDEGMKIANLVGQSIAHLEMYVEFAEDIKKQYLYKDLKISSWTITKAQQVLKSVPKLIKELRKPGIWSEQLEEASNTIYKVKKDGKVVFTGKYNQVLSYRKQNGGEIVTEADLTKPQVKQVHKQAKELPKKDFIKRYGKDGDAIRYATATNQVKNKLGLGENKYKLKGELKMSESYKQRFDSAMGHLGINSLGQLNPEEHKPFFAYVDNLKEGLSAAQKKLPPALQKAIAAKGDKKEDDKEDKKEVKERMGANTPSKPNRYKQYLKRTGQKLSNELTPKQKMLDKDKDGDIGGDDLAKVRATKKEEVKLPDAPSAVKPEVTVKDSNKTAHLGGDKKEKKDADMSKVNDNPKPEEGIKKATASTQANSAQPFNQTEDKKYLQTKPGSLEEAVLISRGLIQERRYMVTYVYDKDGGGSLLDLEVVVDARDEEAAIKKAEPKIEKLRNSSLGRKMGADEVMDGMEDAEPTNEPLSHTDISTNMSV